MRGLVKRRPAPTSFPFLLLLVAAAAADKAEEDDGTTHLYSILSSCPADPEESSLGWVVDFWSHVGPLWSPIADLGILLAFLGLVVPLVCTAIGAAHCAYFAKETLVLMYLGVRGQHIVGEVVGMHTNHWAEHHRSGGLPYCRATIRYRTLTDRLRREFLLQTIPTRRAKVDLLVSELWPKISRIKEGNDSLLCHLLVLMAKLLGLLILSCIVGGLLLTMIIEIIPSLCQLKQALWISYFITFAGYIARLFLVEIRNGATSELANQDDAVGSQLQSPGGYEYVPDVDVDSTSLCEDRPPTALPIAEPVVSIDVNTPLTSARVTRSIFGTHRQDDTDTPAAVATVVDA